MEKLHGWVRCSLVLGLLTIPALLLGHLALTDIGHGEGDLALEWLILQVAGWILVAFVGFALFTLYRVLRVLPNRSRNAPGP